MDQGAESAPKGRRLGLALGGGVARGFAHVGVLAALMEASIPIGCVAGTSVGAIIGAIYATGLKLDHIQEMAAEIRWHRLARPTFSGDGLVTFAGLEAWLERVFGYLHFEDLAVPLAVVATDIETGTAVVLDRGPLAPAVRASCSVPGIVTPRRIEGRLLCDGGIANNVPVAAARQLGADYVVGVDIFQHAPRWPYLGPLGRGLAALEIMVEHSGGGLDEADCLIAPDLSGKSYVRLGQREELQRLGRQATEASLPAIRAGLALDRP